MPTHGGTARRSRAGLTRIGAVSVLIGLVPLLVGCPPAQAPPPVAGVTDVQMVGIAFVPADVTITQGQSVRWINTEAFSIPHTVTSGSPGDPNAGSLFDSGNLTPGQTFTFQFNDVGVFVYWCRVHPNTMFGATVTVVASP